MKELFGVNRTDNKKNRVCDGEELVTRRADEALKQRREALNGVLSDEAQKARLPGILALLRIVALVAGVVCSTIALFADGALKYVTGVAGVLLCACAAVLTVYEKVRSSSIGRTEQTVGLDGVGAVWSAEAAKRLGVPDSAKKIDVFIYSYKNVKGENRVQDGRLIVNAPMYAFVDQDKFCIFDGEKRYDILRSAVKRVERVEEKLTAFGWNRSDKFREEQYPYKKFKIKADEKSGDLTYKFYYKIVFIGANNEYCLRVPSHEADTVTALTGLICPEK